MAISVVADRHPSKPDDRFEASCPRSSMSKLQEELIDWRPALSSADRAEVEQIKAELRRNPPIVRRLRHELALSQAEAAAVLGTTQSNVSKIEARPDPSLSVLRRLVESRGGKLEVKATWPDGRELDLA
jgi:DNA-binding transcriptional regulator YiaG